MHRRNPASAARPEQPDVDSGGADVRNGRSEDGSLRKPSRRPGSDDIAIIRRWTVDITQPQPHCVAPGYSSAATQGRPARHLPRSLHSHRPRRSLHSCERTRCPGRRLPDQPCRRARRAKLQHRLRADDPVRHPGPAPESPLMGESEFHPQRDPARRQRQACGQPRRSADRPALGLRRRRLR